MKIGEGIAFAALVAGAVCLEVSGYKSGGLWFLIVFWVILSN